MCTKPETSDRETREEFEALIRILMEGIAIEESKTED
jgi:hypothetical protein